MEIHNLKQLLVEELRDLYDAEKRLVKALPKMGKAAISPDLKKAIEEHLEQTQNQVTRLEQAFELLGEKARAKTCEAMKGLIAEGDETITDLKKSEQFLDVALIAAAQRVEHYEMAGYGTALSWADRLNLPEVSQLMQETLDEEKAADELLTAISEELLADLAANGNGANKEDAAHRNSRKPAASQRTTAEAKAAAQ